MGKSYRGKHVLILEGYARQCLPFMQSFKKHGCEITLLCGSKLDLGYWSRLPDHKIVGICDPDRYEASRDYICDLIRKGHYDLVVPLVDFSARILSEHKEELSRYSRIASNDADVFAVAQDKLAVMKVCMENDIPCPKTLTGIRSYGDIPENALAYPIVVKPRKDCGAKGFHCFATSEEFAAFSGDAALDDFVVQEYIPQSNRNLSVSLFIDNDGNVKSAYTYAGRRWFPLAGGTGTLNELVERRDAVEPCQKLADLLHLKGSVGFDLIDDPRDGMVKVIEINPRILACAKIGFVGGIDQALMILQKEFGQEVMPQTTLNKKVYIRMTQTDVLWFLKSPDRWKAEPSWFRIRNTHDQTFSWRDPLPWLAFLIRGMTKLRGELEERNAT